MPIDYSHEHRPGVRAFLAAHRAFDAEQRARVARQTGERVGETGSDIAHSVLDDGMPHEHLVAGFHLLFRKVAYLASTTMSADPQAVIRRCAERVALWAAEAEGEGHQLVEEHDGKVRVDPYIAARAVVGYFSADDETWEKTLAPSIAEELWNATQGTPAGFEPLIEGSLRVIEAAYELWLVNQTIEVGRASGRLSENPTESERALLMSVAEQSRLVGLDGLEVYVKEIVAQLGNK